MRLPANVTVLVVLFFASISTYGQATDPALFEAGTPENAYAAPIRQTSEIEALVLATDANSMRESRAIAAWNESGRFPARNGFVRQLPSVLQVALPRSSATLKAGSRISAGVVSAAGERQTWVTAIEVEGAGRLRMRLDQVVLPPDLTLWVYGASGHPVPFDASLKDPDGRLWTPSVDGEKIFLEVELSATAESRFEIAAIGHMMRPVETHATSCLTDSTCVSTQQFENVRVLEAASAQLQFVSGTGLYVCSGALVNVSEDEGFIPYMLTANHCISTQAEASSLEAYWDYQTSTCSGSIPPFSSLERSKGATLLATSASSDFSFLKLSSVPAERWFLGWDARTSVVPSGTPLHRISYPVVGNTVMPQSYSRSFVNTTSATCTGGARPQFLYSDATEGGVLGGSSGAPVTLASGHIVGQLLGQCGPAPSDGCDRRNRNVDGAFSSTYSSIARWLRPDTTPQPCVQSDTVMCLNNGRFKVTATWRDFSGNQGAGHAIRYTADSGLFWFFQNTNMEMLVKVLNGCAANNRYWVLGAATTNVEYSLTVTDSTTGASKTYSNALGVLSPAIGDTSAFGCP
jgi:hypothetical protein